VRQTYLALDDGEVHELTLRVERPEVGLLLVFLFGHSPERRRAADGVGPGAALRLEAHGGETRAHFIGALDTHEHDAAHAEVELLGDPLGGERWIGGNLVRLHDQRMVQPKHRRLVDGVPFHRLREFRERRIAAIEVTLHAAVEDVIRVLVGECVLRQLGGRLWRRGIGGGRRAPAPASGIGWCIDAEDRLLLLQELDDGIQPARALAQGNTARQGEKGNDDATCVHRSLRWSANGREYRERVASWQGEPDGPLASPRKPSNRQLWSANTQAAIDAFSKAAAAEIGKSP
jgi:hypothetical protein